MITYEVQVLEDVQLETLLDGPLHDRCNKTDNEEEDEWVEHLSAGELSRRADNAPNDRRRTENSRARAAEPTRLVGGTHVRNVRKHPRLKE